MIRILLNYYAICPGILILVKNDACHLGGLHTTLSNSARAEEWKLTQQNIKMHCWCQRSERMLAWLASWAKTPNLLTKQKCKKEETGSAWFYGQLSSPNIICSPGALVATETPWCKPWLFCGLTIKNSKHYPHSQLSWECKQSVMEEDVVKS